MTPAGFRQGEIRWAVYDGDRLQHQDAFLLNIIDPPEPLPPGRFYYMCYTNQDLAFHLPELFEKTGELFARSGITGKGRYYKNDARRAALDPILQRKYGFTLFEISLWGGPLKDRKHYQDLVPAAIGADGREQAENCPTRLLDNPAALSRYRETVKEKLIVENTHAVILDFEPWSRPGRICFCPACLEAFGRQAGVDVAGLDAAGLKRQYRVEWTRFWTDITYRYMNMMAAAARAEIPGVEVWDYTYAFPYDDETALSKRFWSVPKDPRRNEDFLDASMISLYHLNGRKAFDQLELSRRHLKKSICSISLVSRSNANTGKYTSPDECLLPRQLGQKAVMTAALGHELFGIYPGHWIDGAVHVSLNKAARLIRTHEHYYFGGVRDDAALTVSVPAGTKRAHYAWTVHRAGAKKLLTPFNFSRQTLEFTVNGTAKIAVPPDDVSLREF